MKPEGFPRRLRLRRRGEFLRVQRGGRKHHTRFFLVFVAPSKSPAGEQDGDPAGLPSSRLGVTVTRKVGKAVKRNRIKRLVREAFRRERKALPSGLDLVFVAKREATDSTYDAVVHDLRQLAERLHREHGSARQTKGERSSNDRRAAEQGSGERTRKEEATQ